MMVGWEILEQVRIVVIICCYDIKYYFVWVTMYRKPALTGVVSLRVCELVREVCQADDIEPIMQSITGSIRDLIISMTGY